MSKTKEKHPDLIFHRGKPTAVILEINDYVEILKQIDDTDQLRFFEEIKQNPENFVLSDFQKESNELSEAGMDDYLKNLEEYEEKLASGEIRW